MSRLRNEFLKQQDSKFNKTELLFETSNKKYIDWLEKIVNKNNLLPVIKSRSKVDKNGYRQSFLDWKNKYFIYKPKTYEYRSINNKDEYTLSGLHKMYKRAMQESPFYINNK